MQTQYRLHPQPDVVKFVVQKYFFSIKTYFMKNVKYLTFVFSLFTISTLWAQEKSELISDEDLKKYAITMDSIDNMRTNLLETISEMVKNNEEITAARYNELSKIIDNKTKLAEAKATPEEIAGINKVIKKRDDGTVAIQEVFMSLAKDYIGAAAYNNVKKGLASDPALKARYEAIKATLKSDVN